MARSNFAQVTLTFDEKTFEIFVKSGSTTSVGTHNSYKHLLDLFMHVDAVDLRPWFLLAPSGCTIDWVAHSCSVAVDLGKVQELRVGASVLLTKDFKLSNDAASIEKKFAIAILHGETFRLKSLCVVGMPVCASGSSKALSSSS